MAILQAIIFMIYQVQVMVLFAYYPEVVSIAKQRIVIHWLRSIMKNCSVHHS